VLACAALEQDGKTVGDSRMDTPLLSPGIVTGEEKGYDSVRQVRTTEFSLAGDRNEKCRVAREVLGVASCIELEPPLKISKILDAFLGGCWI
jgi:hypothetical protein